MEIGKSGSGKTGSLASLVAAGYRLRIMDTDKGINALRSLLTNYKYPYRKYCETHGIDIGASVSYVPIDQNMRVCDGLIPGEKAGEIKPKDARAWDRATSLLTNWIDGDLKLGNINTWTDKDVLVIDSFSTLAYDCYYFVQSFNGRLGAREEGYDFQRDVGGAQSLLRRMLELLYSTSVKCNVIIISHLTWVDTSQGYAQSPDQRARSGVTPNPDGYPSAIGRALSPIMGKYFNDVFYVEQTGSGSNIRREIVTVPQEGVICKNSGFLNTRYDISIGLAEIFATLRNQELPPELIKALGKQTATVAPIAKPASAGAALSAATQRTAVL